MKSPKGVTAAWDTEGQVYFAEIKAGTAEHAKPRGAPGTARGRKNPVAAYNAQGEMILVWSEGIGWARGGALAWQVYDKEGNPTAEKGRIEDGIPVWGLPAVAAAGKGFTIIH